MVEVQQSVLNSRHGRYPIHKNLLLIYYSAIPITERVWDPMDTGKKDYIRLITPVFKTLQAGKRKPFFSFYVVQTSVK